MVDLDLCSCNNTKTRISSIPYIVSDYLCDFNLFERVATSSIDRTREQDGHVVVVVVDTNFVSKNEVRVMRASRVATGRASRARISTGTSFFTSNQ